MRAYRVLGTLMLWGMLVAGGGTAAAGEAEALIEQANASRQLGNTIQTIQLQVTSKSGTVKERVLVTHTRSVDGLEQSHAMFTTPEDLKGVQFVRIQRRGAEDDKWMYMPAGDSLLTIKGRSRTGNFAGTDFTYEDMELGDVNAGTHELLGNETIEVGGDQVACHKIATTPGEGVESAYGKLETWISTDGGVPRQILMYDRDGTTEAKRLTFETVVKDGERSVATRMRMENLKKGSSTLLEVTDYRLDVPAEELPDRLFDSARLVENL
jgi:hypothetical protein